MIYLVLGTWYVISYLVRPGITHSCTTGGRECCVRMQYYGRWILQLSVILYYIALLTTIMVLRAVWGAGAEVRKLKRQRKGR